MENDPRRFEFGSEQYLAHWGCATRYQDSAQYMDGFGRYPGGSSDDCPHPLDSPEPDAALRRRWIQGYIDAATIGGVVGNPTDDDLEKIYSALPAELQAMVDGPEAGYVSTSVSGDVPEPEESEDRAEPLAPDMAEALSAFGEVVEIGGDAPEPVAAHGEPVCTFIHNAIGSLKDAMDSDAARAAGYDGSHTRAWGMLNHLEAETALWKDK